MLSQFLLPWPLHQNAAFRTESQTKRKSQRRLGWTPDYDNVIVNPPWRIVPPGVAYPNPTARVGSGSDGLDYVRSVLETLPMILAPKGKATVPFDLPIFDDGRDPLKKQLELLRSHGCIAELNVVSEISVERQAEISSDTCSNLNHPNIRLKQLFLDHYVQLQIASLLHVKCVVWNTGEKSRTSSS